MDLLIRGKSPLVSSQSHMHASLKPFSVSGRHCPRPRLCRVHTFSCFLEERGREGRLCVLLTPRGPVCLPLICSSSACALCRWKQIPVMSACKQRKEPWTGLHQDSQSRVGFPKGAFRLAGLCFHTKGCRSSFLETWSVICGVRRPVGASSDGKQGPFSHEPNIPKKHIEVKGSRADGR